MEEPSTIHSTFVLERHYPASPAQVFQALADPAKKRRWFAESGAHEVEIYDLDFQVGGVERARYRFKPGGPFAGVALNSQGVHLEITPERRVVIASTMAMEDRIFSASLVTFELLPAADGVTLICTHQGAFFEGADGPEMRQDGWSKLLDQLAQFLAS
jgi:uncharacterized protein YndB with AHSA1/START domain